MAKRTIQGKRAIVTGASSGIGRAIAWQLASQGANVIAVARRADKLDELVGQIRELGVQAQAVAGDVTDKETRHAALVRAGQELGGLDILVNNAGIAAGGRFDRATPERLRRIFEVNLFALVELTREALPLLKNGDKPIIVNMGSIVGHIALPNLSEYCSTKFAIRGFTDALRAELYPAAVDVLLVSPATVETDIWNSMVDSTGSTSWRARRGATPEFVARKVARAIRRGQRELLPGMSPKLFHVGSRLFPGVVAWLMARRH
jgi:short-subunit dehydrogenase